MSLRVIRQRASDIGRNVKSRSSQAITLGPVVLRKPAIAFQWLLSARVAQAALVVSLVVGLFVAPRIRDAVLEKRYPPVTVKKKKLLGLFTTTSTHPDPRLKASRKTVTVVGWICSGGLVMLLLWLHVPAAVIRAATIARGREQDADDLARSDPARGLRLYRSALSLTPNGEHEAVLGSKIRGLKERMPDVHAPARADAHRGFETMPPNGGATVELVQPDPGHSAEVPRVAERYSLREELGRGAMGVVYKSRDEVLDRDVAVKELLKATSREEKTVARFRQEARALAQLNHPFIVQVYDLVEDHGRLWMVMEYVDGGNLSEYLRARDPLSIGEVSRLGMQLAQALSAAHEQSIIHRDLKPLNVLLTPQDTPKVTDFGLARLGPSTVHTMEGAVLGSPHYMSPEQAGGKKVDERSDVYALGIILYEMLTGAVPFQGELSTVLTQHITQKPTPPRKIVSKDAIPPKIERLVLAMLKKDPAKRTPDMATVAQTLSRYAEKQGV